jgi:hypothetical protein
MITNEYKTHLIKLKESNGITSTFFSDDFHCIKNFNQNLTRENLLPRTNNLNRISEKNFVYQKSINFNLDDIIRNLLSGNFRICCEYFLFNLKNILVTLEAKGSKKYFLSNQPKESHEQEILKNIIKDMFYDKTISYGVYYHSMKILDLIQIYSPYYLMNKSKGEKLIYGNSEVTYNIKVIEYEKDKRRDVTENMKVIIENFCDLLFLVDQNEYNNLCIEIKNKIDSLE